MKVLVTGSSGYLGKALVQKLRDRGDTVVGLDLLPCTSTSVQELFSKTQFDCVVHCGGLHQPHIRHLSNEDFVNINIKGTLNLLECAKQHNVKKFIYTSTTSVFGHALKTPGQTNWITEEIVPQPRNIYGVTKFSAENLCKLYSDLYGMHIVTLRVSRFFPEEDSNLDQQHNLENSKANEFTNRRISLNDAVRAHETAIDKIQNFNYDVFILAAKTPFAKAEAPELAKDAPKVLKQHYPHYEEIYAKRGWSFYDTLDRVYDSSKFCTAFDFVMEDSFETLLRDEFKDLFEMEERVYKYEEVCQHKQAWHLKH